MADEPLLHVRAVPPLAVEQDASHIVVSLQNDRATWVQAFATVLASMIAFASIWLVTAQWREQRRARGLEIMMKFQSQFDALDMQATRAEAAANRANPGASPAVLRIFNFFELVGRHRQDGLVTTEQVDYFFQDYALLYWYAFEEWAKNQRKAVGEDPDKGETFRQYQLVVEAIRARGISRPPDAQITFLLDLEQKRYAQMHGAVSTSTAPPAATKPAPSTATSAP